MRYFANVYAYDVMDSVQITVSLRTVGDQEEDTLSVVLHTATTILGKGEDNPREWLRDALVGALEIV